MIIPGQQLREELLALGFKVVEGPNDARVFCPSTDWLQKFGTFIWQTKPQFNPRRYDCEDHSIRALNEATEAFQAAALDTYPEDCGHGFGLCKIGISFTGDLMGVPGGAIPHRLNIVRTATGLVFFEPQQGAYCDAKTAIDDGRVVALHFACV